MPQPFCQSWLTICFAHPAITTRAAAEFLEVRFNSAQKCIDRLMASGVLAELTGNRRNRIFVASDILKAMQGRAKDGSTDR